MGYKVFFYHKLLRKRNKRKFIRKFIEYLDYYKEEVISEAEFLSVLRGWFGYAMWANTYSFREKLLEKFKNIIVSPKTNSLL